MRDELHLSSDCVPYRAYRSYWISYLLYAKVWDTVVWYCVEQQILLFCGNNRISNSVKMILVV